MSYHKAKAISLKPKENKIYITSTANNDDCPYHKWEFCDKEQDYHKKFLELLRLISSGNLQVNDGCVKWKYAILKADEEYCKGEQRQFALYEDMENSTRAEEILEDYYNIFMKYFNEKENKDEKYILYSDKYGYVKPKGKFAFWYRSAPFSDYTLTKKQAYIKCKYFDKDKGVYAKRIG